MVRVRVGHQWPTYLDESVRPNDGIGQDTAVWARCTPDSTFNPCLAFVCSVYLHCTLPPPLFTCAPVRYGRSKVTGGEFVTSSTTRHRPALTLSSLGTDPHAYLPIGVVPNGGSSAQLVTRLMPMVLQWSSLKKMRSSWCGWLNKWVP